MPGQNDDGNTDSLGIETIADDTLRASAMHEVTIVSLIGLGNTPRLPCSFRRSDQGNNSGLIS